MTEADNLSEKFPVAEQAALRVQGTALSLTKTLRKSAALGASVLALGTAVPGEINTALADGTPPNQTTIELCEQDAFDSYSFSPTSNTFKYIKFRGKANKYIRWTIRANAMPPECDGIVQRSIGVQERIGKRRNHLVPNSQFKIADRTNGSVNDKRFVQATIHPYRDHECVQGVVDFIATPTDGSPPVVDQHLTGVVC